MTSCYMFFKIRLPTTTETVNVHTCVPFLSTIKKNMMLKVPQHCSGLDLRVFHMVTLNARWHNTFDMRRPFFPTAIQQLVCFFQRLVSTISHLFFAVFWTNVAGYPSENLKKRRLRSQQPPKVVGGLFILWVCLGLGFSRLKVPPHNEE